MTCGLITVGRVNWQGDFRSIEVSSSEFLMELGSSVSSTYESTSMFSSESNWYGKSMTT